MQRESLKCESTVPPCDEDKTQCTNDGSGVEVCLNGVWTVKMTCENDKICNPQGTDCVDTAQRCDDDSSYCTDNGKLMSCIDNTWIPSDCKAGQICLRGKTTCEEKICDDDEIVCNNIQRGILTCTDNKWLESACPPSKSFCEAEQCVVCINGRTRCKNNAVQICTENEWSNKEACETKSCDVSNPACIDVKCEDTWQRCNGNFAEYCNGNEYTRPAPDSCGNTSYCLELTEHNIACVACTEDKHCLNNHKCINNQCQNTTPNEPIPQ